MPGMDGIAMMGGGNGSADLPGAAPLLLEVFRAGGAGDHLHHYPLPRQELESADSATTLGMNTFGKALDLIAELPLSGQEKTEAVRRLLAGGIAASCAEV